MLFDLHCHTELSDGSTSPEELVRFAKRAGLDGVAISDHDTMAGVERAREEGNRCGLTVIPAVELSAFDPENGRKVHILVYAPRDTWPLTRLFSRVRESRIAAGERMIDLVAKRFPITREQVYRFSEKSDAIFRTHIMRAVMELGYSASVYGAVYQSLFSSSFGSCAVRPEYTPLCEALGAARASGGLVSLAHPGVYRSLEAARLMAQSGKIDALEYYYPRRKPEEIPNLDGLILQFGLLRTGGTDYHGYYSPSPNPVGSCVADDEAVSRILELSRG